MPTGLERGRRIEFDQAGMISAIEPDDGPYDGRFAVPGMPNAHSHAFQRAMVGYGEQREGENDSFWSWRESMYKLAHGIGPDELYAIARACYADALRAGFTSVAEFHYLHHSIDGSFGTEMAEAVVRAARDVGLPIRLLPVYYRKGGFDTETEARQARFKHDSVEHYASFLDSLRGLDVPLGVAPHSLRAAPAADLADLVTATDEVLGADHPIHIHISEQHKEIEDCLAATGRNPVDLLADSVELDQRWHLVHATHATEQELGRMVEAGATAVLCPLTEAYLGDGIFDAVRFLESGGRISIGSDSDVRLDAIEELRILEYGQRATHRSRAMLADSDGIGIPLWSRTARGGAGSLGMQVGELAVGKRADIVALDLDSPVLAAPHPDRVMDAWLTAGSRADIAAVYVGGSKVIDRAVHADDDEIRSAFASCVRRLMT